MVDSKALQSIQAKKWYKIWAGNWSLLSCSHFLEQYTEILDLEGVKFAKNCAIFYRDGASYAFMPEEEKNQFAMYVAKLYTENPEKIGKLISHFRSQADSMIEYCAAQKGTKFNLEKYDDFWRKIDAYYVPHIINKWMVDSLEPVVLEKYLHDLQEARLHAEPVFKRTEELMQQIAEQIGKETGKSPSLVLAARKAEIRTYWQGTPLPDDAILEARRKYSVLTHVVGAQDFFVGDDAKKIEEAIVSDEGSKIEPGTLKGTIAYPGKVRGEVKIILDPTKGDHFREGDILVTGMTRPEYLALMQKAGAFVTDSGGILSHAAIVARELKKPCVIGTQVATRNLKEGMMVEVDADKGLVRIL